MAGAGVIMNDAGIGKDNAGIVGLEFLDQIGMAAATADAQTCHIGDGDHMLAHGVISHVNRAAAGARLRAGPERPGLRGTHALGCRADGRAAAHHRGCPLRACAMSPASRCWCAPIPSACCNPTMRDGSSSRPRTALCPAGRPDNIVPLGIRAVFFSDAGAGGGMDGAGIARLADLDAKGIIAGATSADSAPIGDSRALYRDGILSHVNGPAIRAGARVDMALKDFVDGGYMSIKHLLSQLQNLSPHARCPSSIQPISIQKKNNPSLYAFPMKRWSSRRNVCRPTY